MHEIILLKKLQKDEFADIVITENGAEQYHITFDGAAFIRNGGYVKRKKQEIFNYIMQRVYIALIALAAIVTVVYYIEEYIRNTTSSSGNSHIPKSPQTPSAKNDSGLKYQKTSK